MPEHLSSVLFLSCFFRHFDSEPGGLFRTCSSLLLSVPDLRSAMLARSATATAVSINPASQDKYTDQSKIEHAMRK